MTEIVVSKRDGIARDPEGRQYRVHRGRTLADARHPVVLAYPGDWQPMEIELNVEGDAPSGDRPSAAEVEELRNELAEAEESAEFYAAELDRLREGLAAAGLTLPAEDERAEGWLVSLALETVTVGIDALKANLAAPEPAPVPATAPVAPRAPRSAKPKPPVNG